MEARARSLGDQHPISGTDGTVGTDGTDGPVRYPRNLRSTARTGLARGRPEVDGRDGRGIAGVICLVRRLRNRSPDVPTDQARDQRSFGLEIDARIHHERDPRPKGRLVGFCGQEVQRLRSSNRLIVARPRLVGEHRWPARWSAALRLNLVERGREPFDGLGRGRRVRLSATDQPTQPRNERSEHRPLESSASGPSVFSGFLRLFSLSASAILVIGVWLRDLESSLQPAKQARSSALRVPGPS